MNAIDAFLAKPESRWRRFRLWLWAIRYRFGDWCLRWIYAQHNARELADFEDRMSWLLCHVTGSRMSKPYYAIETMRPIVDEWLQDEYEAAYQEGRKDLAEAYGIDLARACRVCGCTQERACVLKMDGDQVETCAWAEPDLCTACVGKDKAE